MYWDRGQAANYLHVSLERMTRLLEQGVIPHLPLAENSSRRYWRIPEQAVKAYRRQIEQINLANGANGTNGDHGTNGTNGTNGTASQASEIVMVTTSEPPEPRQLPSRPSTTTYRRAELYSVAEASKVTGLSDWTVRKRVRAGVFQGVYVRDDDQHQRLYIVRASIPSLAAPAASPVAPATPVQPELPLPAAVDERVPSARPDSVLRRLDTMLLEVRALDVRLQNIEAALDRRLTGDLALERQVATLVKLWTE